MVGETKEFSGTETGTAMDPLHADHVLAELIRRLAKAYLPERIYLFGSKARGESRPDSDYDILVVVPDDAPPNVAGAGWPIRCCEEPALLPMSSCGRCLDLITAFACFPLCRLR